MAKQALRKLQLVEAAVHEIGETGSLGVTVGQIAKRAGVSSALAFHYFGDKDQLFLEAMRYVLSVYGAEVRAALAQANTPEARLHAIITTNFSQNNFKKEVISAWLNFYVMAQNNEAAMRLLLLYQRRLASNLTHALRPIVGKEASVVAMRIAAMIDGLYLRMVIRPNKYTGQDAEELILGALAREIKGAN